MRQPRTEPVLDHDEGQTSRGYDLGDDRPHRGGGLGVEHRQRLVEQQDPWTEGQGAREGESLLLASGEARG